MDCIFCRIAAGELPCHKVYEDQGYLAFLDIRPLNPGHTLVIPKQHWRWVWDSPEIGSYYKVVQKAAQALKKTFATDYVVSLVFGEEVPHAHVWLVPRLPEDGHGEAIDLGNFKQIPETEMAAIAAKIRENIA